MLVEIQAKGEALVAVVAPVRLGAEVDPAVARQTGRVCKTLVAVWTLVRTLAGVNAEVDGQGVALDKRLVAYGALVAPRGQRGQRARYLSFVCILWWRVRPEERWNDFPQAGQLQR